MDRQACAGNRILSCKKGLHIPFSQFQGLKPRQLPDAVATMVPLKLNLCVLRVKLMDYCALDGIQPIICPLDGAQSRNQLATFRICNDFWLHRVEDLLVRWMLRCEAHEGLCYVTGIEMLPMRNVQQLEDQIFLFVHSGAAKSNGHIGIGFVLETATREPEYSLLTHKQFSES